MTTWVTAWVLCMGIGIFLMATGNNEGGWGSYFVGASLGIALASMLP